MQLLSLLSLALAIAFVSRASPDEVSERAPPPQPKGIDVSWDQSHVDLAAAKANGIEFVYVKATEGISISPPFYRMMVGSLSYLLQGTVIRSFMGGCTAMLVAWDFCAVHTTLLALGLRMDEHKQNSLSVMHVPFVMVYYIPSCSPLDTF